MNWIEYQEEEPKNNQLILAVGIPEYQNPYNKDVTMETNPKVYACIYDKTWHSFNLVSSGCGCCDQSLSNVSKWMPMPDAPKEEKE